MAVIRFKSYKRQKYTNYKKSSCVGVNKTKKAEIVSFTRAKDTELVAPERVEHQINKDLRQLVEAFFDMLPRLDETDTIRVTLDENGGFNIKGPAPHLKYYETYFNESLEFRDTYIWLMSTISMMVYSKEMTEYSLRYLASSSESARKYQHIAEENNGITFCLEFREGNLSAFADSPLRRYYRHTN